MSTSDTRRLTGPTLYIRGQVDENNILNDNIHENSSSLAWFRSLLNLLRCSRRTKEWDANQRTSAQLATLNTTLTPRNPSQLNFNWLSANAVTDIFKILLVFPREDQQSEIIATVARKLGWNVTEARNAEEANQMFLSHCHDIVIIDRRSLTRNQDADKICRSLTGYCEIKRPQMVALTKKSFFTAPHKDEVVILQLLNIGYTKALMECSHEGILMNELIGMYAGETQPKSHLAAAQLLYLAVDRCRDIVHVTNDQHIVQYVNKATEKILGYKSEELMNRNLEDFITSDNFALMNESLKKGHEFEGNIKWKRKEKSLIVLGCRVVPMQVAGGKTMYYVYLYDSIYGPDAISRTSLMDDSTSSARSVGRHSLDARFNPPRRSTMAKISDLPLEAPITKIIGYLNNAIQDSASPDVTQEIEKAIQLLKSTELYTPQLKDNGNIISDPVTSDLVGALTGSKMYNDRRSTTSFEKHSAILFSSIADQYKPIKLTKTPEIPVELEELLERGFEWGFDIFKLETITNRRPLFYLGMTLMEHYRVAEMLQCEERTLQNWLTIIEANYNSNVSYHNSTHATDVLQAIARFMRSERLQTILDPMDEVAALLAAAAHDVGHPGKSSQFLCNANNRLAILYNDLTVLESHHSALTFRVTLADENVNIFKNLNRDLYKAMRQNIIDMILATEMTKHFEHLAKFVNICSNRIDDIEGFEDDVLDMSIFLLPENVTLTKRMMIKCADVSNPTRPFRLYLEWTRRIAEEYFDQTDEEKRNNLPVVMPMFDRATCSIPKSQIGFVDYIINDMMEAWDAFIDISELVGNMRENYEKWKNLYEQGVSSLQDIQNLQETPEFRLYRRVSRKESKKNNER